MSKKRNMSLRHTHTSSLFRGGRSVLSDTRRRGVSVTTTPSGQAGQQSILRALHQLQGGAVPDFKTKLHRSPFAEQFAQQAGADVVVDCCCDSQQGWLDSQDRRTSTPQFPHPPISSIHNTIRKHQTLGGETGGASSAGTRQESANLRA